MPSPSLPVPMSPDLVKRLLDALASDDQFRTLFEKDPAAALIQLGYPLEKTPAAREQLEALVARIGVATLADKHAIAQARDAITASLTNQLKMLPIMLDANDGNGFTRKD